MSIEKLAHRPREQFRHRDDTACTCTGRALRLDGNGQRGAFHHGGFNDSDRAWMEDYLETGDGFVSLINGENGAERATVIRNALSDRWLQDLSLEPTILSTAMRVRGHSCCHTDASCTPARDPVRSAINALLNFSRWVRLKPCGPPRTKACNPDGRRSCVASAV